MSGLVSFLLFAAFFYVMMRFGCGRHVGHGGHVAHGGHGGHGGHHEERPPESGDPPTSAIDPVCGMAVAAGAGYSTTHQGAQYRFCSRECLGKFDAAPERYKVTAPTPTEHGSPST